MKEEAKLSAELSELYEKMMEKYEAKAYAEAMTFCDQILAVKENHGETLSMKGLLLIKIEPSSKEEALRLLKLGIRNHMTSSLTWHALAIYHRDEGHYEESIKVYKTAVMRSQNKIGMYKDMTHISLVLRNYKNAYEFSTSIIGINPKAADASIYNIRAISEYIQSNYKEAKSIIQEARTLNKYGSVDKHHSDEICYFEALANIRSGNMTPISSILQNTSTDDHMKNSLMLLSNIYTNNIKAARENLTNLIKAYPANLDYLLLYIYVDAEPDVRNAFGDPLSKYRRGPNSRITAKHCLNNPTFDDLVKLRVVGGQPWEPFRGDLEHTTPLRDSGWQREIANTNIYIYYKTEIGAKAKVLRNYINILTYMDDPNKLEKRKPTSARMLNLMNEIKNISGSDRYLKGFSLYLYMKEDREVRLREFIIESVTKGVASLVRDLTPFIIYKGTRDYILKLSNELESTFVTEDRNLTNISIQIYYYLYMAELMTLYQDYDVARQWYKKAMEINPYACNVYSVAVIVELRAGGIELACKYGALLAEYDVTEKCQNTLSASTALIAGDIEEGFLRSCKYTTVECYRDIMNPQSTWFFKLAAESALRFDRIGEALVFLSKLLEDSAESLSDCFDFHQYSSRKGVLIHYTSFVATLSRFYEFKDHISSLSQMLMLQLHILKNPNIISDYYSCIKDKELYERPTPKFVNPNAAAIKDQDITGIKIITKMIENDEANILYIKNEVKTLSKLFVDKCPIVNQAWFFYYSVGHELADEAMQTEAIEKLEKLDIDKNCMYLWLIRASRLEADAKTKAIAYLENIDSGNTNILEILCALFCLHYFCKSEEIKTYLKHLPNIDYTDSIKIYIYIKYYPLPWGLDWEEFINVIKLHLHPQACSPIQVESVAYIPNNGQNEPNMDKQADEMLQDIAVDTETVTT